MHNATRHRVHCVVHYGMHYGMQPRLQQQHRRGERGFLRGTARRGVEAARDGQRSRREQPVQHLLAHWVAASGTRVAGSGTRGCSLWHTELQPPAPRVAARRNTVQPSRGSMSSTSTGVELPSSSTRSSSRRRAGSRPGHQHSARTSPCPRSTALMGGAPSAAGPSSSQLTCIIIGTCTSSLASAHATAPSPAPLPAPLPATAASAGSAGVGGGCAIDAPGGGRARSGAERGGLTRRGRALCF